MGHIVCSVALTLIYTPDCPTKQKLALKPRPFACLSLYSPHVLSLSAATRLSRLSGDLAEKWRGSANAHAPSVVYRGRRLPGRSDNSGSPFADGWGSPARPTVGGVTTTGPWVVPNWNPRPWKAWRRGTRLGLVELPPSFLGVATSLCDFGTKPAN